MNLLNPLSTPHVKATPAGSSNTKTVETNEGDKDASFDSQLQAASTEKTSVSDLKIEQKTQKSTDVEAGEEANNNAVIVSDDLVIDTESNAEVVSDEVVSDEMVSVVDSGVVSIDDSEDITSVDNVDDGESIADVEKMMFEGADFLQRLNQSNQQLSQQSSGGGKALPPQSEQMPSSDASLDVKPELSSDKFVLDSSEITSIKQNELTEKEKVLQADVKPSELKLGWHAATAAVKAEKSDEATLLSQPTIDSELKSTLSGVKAEHGIVNAFLSGEKNSELIATNGMMEAVRKTLVDGQEQEQDTISSQPLSALMSNQQTNAMKMDLQHANTQVQSPLLLTKEQAGEQVSERINMMMAKNLKQIDIRLDPPELGKIQIKLALNQDQASVQFTVNNSQTRDMVEQAMPRLREMMQQQGLQLAQGSVQQDSSNQFAQQFSQQHSGEQSSGAAHDESFAGTNETNSDKHLDAIEMFVTNNKDRVDYYA
ncbi:flagellar hook-length control protein FliK [Photobacterium sp. GB-3]|uniref:flagellar hook-length control protein FliK n=1 Tax=Photobacterium sp. GB-3 TaxID=2022110 RepID=UPI000D176F24|nr:flagellar hook-length control protein FliK [Photobacterium sp. GB-3]PSV58083.1 flagellar hook-length control protein FliK [Photobacterium sp. GB-3]